MKKIKVPIGFGGKYKNCEVHNIDTLNSPENFYFRKDKKEFKRYDCKICVNTRNMKYYFSNKKKIISQQRKYKIFKKKTDPEYKLLHNMRKRMWAILKKQKKSDSTLKLTGCSLEELRKHLESKFEDGMSWDNYGVWHVDHIIACANFDLSDPEQQKICFHYTNLQPMWGEKNIQKGSRLI
jgi:hypothetical protein